MPGPLEVKSNELFQTEEELRGCTKAQYKIHKDYFELSGKATLVETKHEITELETSMALRQSV